MFSKIVTSCPSFGLYGITESQNTSNMVQNMVKKLKKFRLLASPVFFVIIILKTCGHEKVKVYQISHIPLC